MKRGTKRRIVTRRGRRFSVCGLPAKTARSRGPARNGLGWATSATLLVAILYCAFAIGRPPAMPAGAEMSAGLAHYSIDDFIAASH